MKNRYWIFSVLLILAVISSIALYRHQNSDIRILRQLAAEYGIKNYVIRGDILIDSIEFDKKYIEHVGEAESYASEIVNKSTGDSPLQKKIKYEMFKKEYLLREFNISWRSTEEMNPWLE